jgi:hypothetical protein
MNNSFKTQAQEYNLDNVKSVKAVKSGRTFNKVEINSDTTFQYFNEESQEYDGSYRYKKERVVYSPKTVDEFIKSGNMIVSELDEPNVTSTKSDTRDQEFYTKFFNKTIEILENLGDRYESALNKDLNKLRNGEDFDQILLAKRKEGFELIKHIIDSIYNEFYKESK